MTDSLDYARVHARCAEVIAGKNDAIHRRDTRMAELLLQITRLDGAVVDAVEQIEHALAEPDDKERADMIRRAVNRLNDAWMNAHR